jgi:hypothetical protein
MAQEGLAHIGDATGGTGTATCQEAEVGQSVVEGAQRPLVSKFIQIAATRRADGSPVLYALDESGAVWWLSADEKEWRQVVDTRTAGVEEPRFPPRGRK